MIKSYIKLALRNMKRNMGYVIFNVVGLGIAMACLIIAYLSYDYNQNFDSFHEKSDQIYRLNSIIQRQERQIEYGIVPMAVITHLQEQLKGQVRSSRYHGRDINIKSKDDYFSTGAGFVDEDFMDMFTFEMVSGDAHAYLDKSTILISEATAQKFFPDQNPLGSYLTLSYAPDNEREYRIGGVYKDVQRNSSFIFDALAHIDNDFELLDFEENSWRFFARSSFVELDNDADLPIVQKELASVLPLINELRGDSPLKEIRLQPLSEVAKTSRDMPSHLLNESLPSSAVIGPIVMSGLLLLIACFNFTNTAIAASSRRLKEIGVRKTMGGLRKQLIFQFLGENIVLIFGAILVAILLSEFLVPAYNSMWRFLEIDLDYLENLNFLLFLVAVMVLCAVVAGAYPSLYISNFKPANILKGGFKLGGTNRFTRVLLTLLFSISLSAIVASIIFYQNALYQENVNLGVSRESVVGVDFNDQSKLVAIRGYCRAGCIRHQ